MISPVQPRELRVPRKKLCPLFERVWSFDAKLSCPVHNIRAWVWSEDIGPEFSSRKAPADVHDEVHGLSPLFLAFSWIRKDNVEGRTHACCEATRRALVDVLKFLKGLVHCLQ